MNYLNQAFEPLLLARQISTHLKECKKAKVKDFQLQ